MAPRWNKRNILSKELDRVFADEKEKKVSYMQQ